MLLCAVQGRCYTLGCDQFGQLGRSSSPPQSDVSGRSCHLGRSSSPPQSDLSGRSCHLGRSSSPPQSDVSGRSCHLGQSSSPPQGDLSGRSCHLVTRLEGHVVTKVACGDSFTVAVTKRMCLSVCLSFFLSLSLIVKAL